VILHCYILEYEGEAQMSVIINIVNKSFYTGAAIYVETLTAADSESTGVINVPNTISRSLFDLYSRYNRIRYVASREYTFISNCDMIFLPVFKVTRVFRRFQ